MPKAAHAALKKQAKKKGLKDEEEDAYVYGAMKKIEKGKKKKGKGK